MNKLVFEICMNVFVNIILKFRVIACNIAILHDRRNLFTILILLDALTMQYNKRHSEDMGRVEVDFLERKDVSRSSEDLTSIQE